MFWRTENDLVPPNHHLTHIDVNILAAFGDNCVKPPDYKIAKQQKSHGTIATRWIDKGIEQPSQQTMFRIGGFSDHHVTIIVLAAERNYCDR